MTHTKKRILAMLLAVVLCFSALPFSVSADEVSSALPSESSLESQLEESQAEETEESPPPAENAIILSDSSGDVPVLYAQDPFNTVKSEVEGGTNYMTSVGVTRQAIVQELEAHENDDFYLGTKYVGGDAQSPNGDASYNSGTVGMNCAGFISYVLRKAGLDAETTMEIIAPDARKPIRLRPAYDWLAGASNYKNLIENGNISAYAFRTKQELLSSGLAEKGDIILMWWSNSPGADGADNHIGFFWGKASDDDVMWHSGTEPSSGNQISEITPKTPGSFYILIKIEPLQPSLRSALAQEIFLQDLVSVYQQQTAHRDELRRASREKVAGLVQQISGGACENPKLESLLRELAEKLSNVKGKKVYGYLRPELKALVNQIVDELAKDERIAQLYDLWYQDKQAARNVYDERPLQRVPLSENPDIKPVRNAVIQAAIVLPPTPISTVEDEAEPEIKEPPLEEPLEFPPAFSQSRGKRKTFWTEEYREARLAMYGDQVSPPDLPLAVRLMRELADGNPVAAHDLGALLLKGMGCQADEDEAQRWFQKALSGFQKAASTEKKPAYFQYRVGKMHAMGYGVEQDCLEAARWYERAVQHNNYPFAAYALGCLYLRGQGVEKDGLPHSAFRRRSTPASAVPRRAFGYSCAHGAVRLLRRPPPYTGRPGRPRS